MAQHDDSVREEWRSVAVGWRRWEPLFQSFTWPLALRMAAVAQIGDAQRVLDVGCGIGDPTLQVAVLVGPHGRVVGVDLVEDMIATARERAAALGLGHVEFRAGDIATIDLPPHAFDVVLGRWSLIYVADASAVLRRLHEVLVPGGRIAVAAWAPPDVNPWITIPMEALARVLTVPPPDRASPGLFHYAPREHGLERRADCPEALFARLTRGFPPQAFLLALSSVHWREAWKYGERAFRYCQHDAGHAIGALRIAAATLGWSALVLDGTADATIERLLGLDREADFQGAERENAELVMALWPGDAATNASSLDAEAVQELKGQRWYGKANRLSRDDPVPWEAIERVAAAARKP